MARGRSAFLPVRKTELIEALVARMDLASQDQARYRAFCRLLASLLHQDYFDNLERLRDDYAYFDPSTNPPRSTQTVDLDAVYQDLTAGLDMVLRQANFEEISAEELDRIERDTTSKRVRTKAPKWAYETVRFFRRGQATLSIEEDSNWWFGSRKETVEAYDDVVLFVRFKGQETKKGAMLSFAGGKRLPAGARPGSVLIKYFQDMPMRDLGLLYPDVRIVMSRTDALLLGGPALAGAIPILLNIVPALSVVLVLGGALLGFQGTITQSQLMQALGAMAVLVGAGAFVFRQYSNYSFKRLKYQKRIADHIYFKNVNNNAGVFETLIGAAEEQDAKEAILAYTFLRAFDGAPDKGTLDQRIEGWLRGTFDLDIDFEIGDALAKLESFGLVQQVSDGSLNALPLKDAIMRLDALWDGIFQHRETGQ